MSKLFKFSKASERKTECYLLTIFDVLVLISYETPVAFNYRGQRYRQKNHWGPTTRRHMSLDADVYDWPVIDNEDEFMAKLDAAIMANVLKDKETLHKAVTEVVARELVGERA